jgi:hypothetical protein
MHPKRTGSLSLLGNPALLDQRLIGLLCSRRVPEALGAHAVAWARSARELRFPVVGGFLSPVERECLEVLLAGRRPVVVCLARGLAATRIPRALAHAAGPGGGCSSSPPSVTR